MNYLNLVSPAIDILKNLVTNGVGLLGVLSTKAAANPKTALTTAVAGLGGLNPEYIVAAGQHIANFGLFVSKVGQLIGG